MNPLILGGLAWLGWKAFGEWLNGLAGQAEDERRHIERIQVRRRRSRVAARRLVLSASLIATQKLIGILKDERRAAAAARNTLRWGSPEREEAHGLVELLSRRLNRQYVEKRRLWTALDGQKTRTPNRRDLGPASRQLIGA